jgi:hypothetical protein
MSVNQISARWLSVIMGDALGIWRQSADVEALFAGDLLLTVRPIRARGSSETPSTAWVYRSIPVDRTRNAAARVQATVVPLHRLGELVWDVGDRVSAEAAP